MISEERRHKVLAMLKEAKAVITDDHFVYTSGRHGSAYVNKDIVYPWTRKIAILGQQIAHAFWKNLDYDVVVGPEKGGIILSQWVAYNSLRSDDGEVLAVYAEKKEQVIHKVEGKAAWLLGFLVSRALGDQHPTVQRLLNLGEELIVRSPGFEFKRGQRELVAGKRVLVVEDVLNTGGSLRRLVEAVREAGGEVVAAAAICNRGKVTAADIGDVPELISLVEVELEAWEADNCPLCKAGVPINTELGKGREFLASKQ